MVVGDDDGDDADDGDYDGSENLFFCKTLKHLNFSFSFPESKFFTGLFFNLF